MKATILIAAALAATAVPAGAQTTGEVEAREARSHGIGARGGMLLSEGDANFYVASNAALRFNRQLALAVEIGARRDQVCRTGGGDAFVCGFPAWIGFASIGPRVEFRDDDRTGFLTGFAGRTNFSDSRDLYGFGLGMLFRGESGIATVPELTMQWVESGSSFDRVT